MKLVSIFIARIKSKKRANALAFAFFYGLSKRENGILGQSIQGKSLSFILISALCKSYENLAKYVLQNFFLALY